MQEFDGAREPAGPIGVVTRFMRPHPKPMPRVLVCSLFALGLAGFSSFARAEAGFCAGRKASAESRGLEPSASQLRRLKSVAEVECWLAHEVPEGLTLSEAPDFFAAADEVFFNAEENLFIYAYRSASTGGWIAWVAFDADRTGVVHTAAIAVDR